MIEWTIGTIMAVEAVLLNHIDKKPVMPMKVSSKDLEGNVRTIVEIISANHVRVEEQLT